MKNPGQLLPAKPGYYQLVVVSLAIESNIHQTRMEKPSLLYYWRLLHMHEPKQNSCQKRKLGWCIITTTTYYLLFEYLLPTLCCRHIIILGIVLYKNKIRNSAFIVLVGQYSGKYLSSQLHVYGCLNLQLQLQLQQQLVINILYIYIYGTASRRLICISLLPTLKDSPEKAL